MTDSPDYLAALKRERDREYRWRHTQQGLFESAFEHLDGLAVDEDDDGADNPYLSDKGLGEAIIAAVCEAMPEDEFRRKREAARKRIERNCPECKRTLELIMTYGKERQCSISTSIRDAFIEKLRRQKISKRLLRNFQKRTDRHSASDTSATELKSPPSTASA